MSRCTLAVDANNSVHQTPGPFRQGVMPVYRCRDCVTMADVIRGCIRPRNGPRRGLMS
jgi:hypothetical protein